MFLAKPVSNQFKNRLVFQQNRLEAKGHKQPWSGVTHPLIKRCSTVTAPERVGGSTVCNNLTKLRQPSCDNSRHPDRL